VRGNDRDPVVEDAVLGAVEAVDDYLRMLDARSIGKRMSPAVREPVGTSGRGTPGLGGEAEAGLGGKNIETATVRVLDKAALEIETRLNLQLGGAQDGVVIKDRMDAREDML
jgi:hypothetical protein